MFRQAWRTVWRDWEVGLQTGYTLQADAKLVAPAPRFPLIEVT